MTENTDMQRGIIEGLALDTIVRNCLAGHGRWTQLQAALRSGGFISTLKNGEGYRFVDKALRQNLIRQTGRGNYVANCPCCGEPILNVFGAEH